MSTDTHLSSHHRFTAITVGVVAILTAMLSLLISIGTLHGVVSVGFGPGTAPLHARYFHSAYFLMSGVCILCYVLILVSSIGIIRGRPTSGRLLVRVLAFEVVYFFVCGFLWFNHTIAPSIAAASVIANAGMMYQFLILLPVWAPFALWRTGLLRVPQIGSVAVPGRSPETNPQNA